MKAEHFQERKLELSGWAVCLSSYLLGREWHCKADNVSPGAALARTKGQTRQEAEDSASHAQERYLPERSVTSSNDESGASMVVQFVIVAKGREIEAPVGNENVNVGTDVLDIGPGFGATTALLIDLARRLTCVEINTRSAHSLARRLANQNVRVIQDDVTRMSLPDCSFDTIVCFAMPHHVASAALQDCLLKEAFRVLRPGGTFTGATGDLR